MPETFNGLPFGRPKQMADDLVRKVQEQND